MNTINRLSDNTGTTNPADYQEDAFVHSNLIVSGSNTKKVSDSMMFSQHRYAPIELSYDDKEFRSFR